MKRPDGRAGEDYAAALLEQRGYRIVARNVHSRFGEIDLIAEKDSFLVFVEVKTRSEGCEVGPLESVTPAKQRKIVKTALLYLQAHPTPLQPRFDVIGILTQPDGTVRSAEQIENAF